MPVSLDAALAPPHRSLSNDIEAAVAIFGVPLEFLIFAATLVGVAILHRHALPVALVGLAATIIYRLAALGLDGGLGWLGALLAHEWPLFTNLLLLLLGFAVLSNQFEESGIPDAMPRLLPDNWTGGLVLLGIVFVLSAFLDNIAGAIIGGVVAKHVYQGRVSIGFLASIVAAANAGGAGSVIGDTTTTMMWISGISPLDVLDAFIAAFVSFAVFGVLGAFQQHRYAPIQRHVTTDAPAIDWARAVIVLVILVAILTANLVGNALFPESQDLAPWLGMSLWIAIGVTALVRRPRWNVLPSAAKGALFLVALVATASMMPVDRLPAASWPTAFGLGFLSAVFDNIPLTALALKQGGYDWGLLAFAVGFGGSMVWFGSSAGVALSNLYPQARSVGAWLRHGWYVPVAYVAGFFALLLLLGWHPS